jgi:hypothetical protein
MAQSVKNVVPYILPHKKANNLFRPMGYNPRKIIHETSGTLQIACPIHGVDSIYIVEKEQADGTKLIYAYGKPRTRVERLRKVEEGYKIKPVVTNRKKGNFLQTALQKIEHTLERQITWEISKRHILEALEKLEKSKGEYSYHELLVFYYKNAIHFWIQASKTPISPDQVYKRAIATLERLGFPNL